MITVVKILKHRLCVYFGNTVIIIIGIRIPMDQQMTVRYLNKITKKKKKLNL